jgi:hypothetical protein
MGGQWRRAFLGLNLLAAGRAGLGDAARVLDTGTHLVGHPNHARGDSRASSSAKDSLLLARSSAKTDAYACERPTC